MVVKNVVISENIGMVVGVTNVVAVGGLVVEVCAIVVGTAFSGGAFVGAGDTCMVVGFTAVVVEASVVEDCAVVVGAAFVVVEGAVELGEDMSVVVGVTSVVV